MKSKKILTILLSLAIMFTFMPAMAFAQTNPGSWDATYDNYIVGENSYKVVSKVWSSGTGMVTATLVGSTEEGAPTTAGNATVSYWDLSGAFVADNSKHTSYNHDTFANLIEDEDTGELKLASAAVWVGAPTTTGVTVDPADKNASVAFPEDGNFNVEMTESGFVKNSFDKQEVTLTATIKSKRTGTDGAADAKLLVGTQPITTKVTVNGASKNQNAVVVALDDLENGDKVLSNGQAASTVPEITYDGAAHTLVANSVPGYTTTYKLQDNTTKVFSDANPVSVTNAGTYYVEIIVVKDTDPTTKLVDQVASFKINKAWTPRFGFVTNKTDANGNTYASYSTTGSEYDAKSFIGVEGSVSNDASYKKQIAASKKAVAANETELLAFFNDYYNVVEKPVKGEENTIGLSIEKKEITKSADQKALAKKYETLISNIDVDPSTRLDSLIAGGASMSENLATKATLTINAKSADNEVTFTKAISSKTYKKSKTTKKGALKKNQTIQFTAETPNGTAVKYKLVNVNTSKIKIDSATGKVTLKKGLAKGTYKFIVKAYIPGDRFGYETQNVTIKVKK